MTCQLDTVLDAHADSKAVRLVRIAKGDRETAQESLHLALLGDPILRLAVERAGVKHFVRNGLAAYADLTRTGGAYLAAHPE